MVLKNEIHNLGKIGNMVRITGAIEEVAQDIGGVTMSAVASLVARWMADGSYDEQHACA